MKRIRYTNKDSFYRTQPLILDGEVCHGVIEESVLRIYKGSNQIHAEVYTGSIDKAKRLMRKRLKEFGVVIEQEIRKLV